ncbi:MAG: hypothetical protein LIR46_14230 [Bacteroidota bacterium]|nr:hypothetical protein [Bacteroidota bacterium]
MKKIKLEPGKKYKGYAVLNEYGEINFTPSQIGSKPDQKKIVKEEDDYTIYSTKNYVIASIKLSRELSFMKRISSLMGIIDKLIQDFKHYDF